MSAPVTSDASNTVGSIEIKHITAKGENHYCCRWIINDILSDKRSEKKFKSPVFTIPDRDTCKWYLSFQSLTNTSILSSDSVLTLVIRLVLDRESDCKEVNAKIKFSIDDPYQGHQDKCNLQSSSIFKLSPKLENKTDNKIFTATKSSLLKRDKNSSYFLIIACDMTIETTVLKDNSHPTDFGYLLKNQLFTDVALSVGEKKYPAHKAILATRSSVFAAMFAHNMIESLGVVNIEDMSEDVVEEMLRYIYTGEVEKLNDLAQDLLVAADKYDLKGLRIKCEEILIDRLSSSNAFDLLLLAQSYNASELKREAINFITTIRSKSLKKTSAWDRLFQSNPELVRELFEAVFRPKFTAAETEVE